MNNRSSGSKSTGVSQACAACKYQRRKCVPNCPLAPFFPPHRQKEFLNAHKLFGVSNMLKTLRDLGSDHEKNAIAMNTMIYEANARARDPVGGCSAIIGNLYRQIHHVQAELSFVRQQLSTTIASMNVNEDANGNSVILYDSVANQEQSQQVGYCHKLKEDEPSSSNTKQSMNNPVQTCVDDAPYREETFEDVSEDVKPFLGAFTEGDNTVFFDSLSDEVAMEEDCKRIHCEQEQDIKGAA